MKKILIGLTPKLISDIDQEAHKQGISRSEWLRNTLRKILSIPVTTTPEKPRSNPYREVRRV